jgi:hypothetical protein
MISSHRRNLEITLDVRDVDRDDRYDRGHHR